jgi:hypothetical protein
MNALLWSQYGVFDIFWLTRNVQAQNGMKYLFNRSA